MTDYDEFLHGKVQFKSAVGFDITDDEINPLLKPHQRDIVKWAVKGGRRALFEAFGLGKTMQQLEIIRLTLEHHNSTAAAGLIVCPLQFDIVDRLIERYSNPGELVYDPFGGLFTVPLQALKAGRRGRAVELNPGYFMDGVAHLKAQEAKAAMPSLFDLAEAVS